MCVVFDTNVVVSGLLWSGAPRQALNIAAARQVSAMTSELLIDELRDVLKREKFRKTLERSQKTPEAWVENYLSYTTIIEPASVPEESVRDIDDLRVLEAAIGGKAVCIVSGDDDLLSLGSYAGIPILPVRAFIQRMMPDDTP
jgi:hypothetical protein